MVNGKRVVLLLIFFNYFHLIASSSPLHKSFVSDSMQKHDIGLVVNMSNIKYAHGGAKGGQSSGAHGNAAENGNNNGNSQAVVPVIIAGAANNNRPKNIHRGAANSNTNSIRFTTIMMITLSTLIVHIYM